MPHPVQSSMSKLWSWVLSSRKFWKLAFTISLKYLSRNFKSWGLIEGWKRWNFPHCIVRQMQYFYGFPLWVDRNWLTELRKFTRYTYVHCAENFPTTVCEFWKHEHSVRRERWQKFLVETLCDVVIKKLRHRTEEVALVKIRLERIKVELNADKRLEEVVEKKKKKRRQRSEVRKET